MYCRLAFPQEVYQTYTYKIPEEFIGKLKTGMRVKASFGSRAQIGYCLDVFPVLPAKPAYNLKSISEVVDTFPIFTAELIKLITWISEYYLAPIGICCRAAHPSEAGFKKTQFCFVRENEDVNKWPEIPAGGLSMMSFLDLTPARQKELHEGIRSSVLYIDNIFPKAKEARRVKAVKLIDSDVELTKRQQEVINLLSSLDKPMEEQRVIRRKLQCSPALLKKLIEIEALQECEMEVPADPFEHLVKERIRDVRLSDEQKAVIETIEKNFNHFYPALLHGVTGSGKTEVYIELAKKQLALKKSVLIMVPEIAITPQIAARFRSTFGDKVAIWHSKMSDAERLWTWTQIQKGAIHVIVGARSSLLTPMKNIGLIVVDEEQESSYKQEEPAPRYHARDAAVMYAHILGIPVVLGSATPSLESYYLSALHRYERLEIKNRFGAANLPKVHLIDMLEAPRQGLFSKELLDGLAKTLSDNKQAIILQNRRGYNTVLVCSDCQQIHQCPDCSVALTYHKKLDKLICHVCNASFPPTRTCMHCGTETLDAMGHGTQKIEEELSVYFPEAKIARMDMDTTRTKHAHARILNEFEEGKQNILLGTQMIAKGLDFPNVTLVAIINADTGMGIPDHRANERLFQLIYQVSGRAGRSIYPGEVFIQTFSPEEPVIKMAAGLELRSFYNLELYQRRELNYPPFSRLFLVRVSGKYARDVEAASFRLQRRLLKNMPACNCIGPAPAAIEKIKEITRWQILIKADRKQDPNGNKTASILQHVVKNFKQEEKYLKILINRDPVSLM